MGDQGGGVGAFLRARRDALQPEDVGLAREAGRRVPGLRREEVAQLAGISPEYYLRLEQGRDHQPSEQVLAALSRALLLDAGASAYLHRLAHPFRHRAPLPAQRPPTGAGADATGAAGAGVAADAQLAAVVDALRGTPAIVADANKDVVASNAMARALLPASFQPGRNVVLEVFAPAVKALMPGWEALARRTVAALRLVADPRDARLQQVVGTLGVRDEDFRRWWAAHEVRSAVSGTVPVAVEGVGVVDLAWHDLEVPGRDGHVLTVFSPGGARAEHALDVVAQRAWPCRGLVGAPARS